jgi:hypothetical protein
MGSWKYLGGACATNGAQALDIQDPKFLEVLDDFVSVASFQPVAKITSSAWTEHAPFAFWLVDILKPRCLVELGVFRGFSYLAMCQAASTLNPRPRCYGVDNWRGDEHAGFYGEEVFKALKDYHDPLYSDFSQLIRSNFDAAASRFPDGSIDLLHIDGRHYYEDVKHDFETWQPKLSEQAIVLLHDTNVHAAEFGVWKFWKELIGQYPSFEFFHGHGLGVLGCGCTIAPAVKRLLSSKDFETANAIRSIYHRLGAFYSELERLPEVTAQIETTC